MNHVSGIAREQITLFPEAIEDYISAENPVRFLDVFVDQLDTAAAGFQHATVNDTGRPPYHPGDLLKLYLYGYLNRVRTSRLLERDTKRNLEVVWLLKRLSPDHKTISDFRKDNAQALREAFKEFVVLCKQLALFGAELVAIDSTKFKASNARDRVKDKHQLDKGIARINDSISQYLAQLDENDTADDRAVPAAVSPEELQQKISSLKQQRATLERARTELQDSGQKYISLTDPDCRLMKNERRIEPAYALQTAVDAKHSLIIDYELTQDAADNNHLAPVAKAAQQILGVETLPVCADAGYYDTVDLKTCDDQTIITYVPVPEPKISKKTQVPTPDYYHDKFVYDQASDTYCCPQGHTMHRFRSQPKNDGRRIYLYRTDACGQCPVRAQCTTSPRGRYISRWEHEAVLERLKERLAREPEIIKRRKAIIEHVFGTIKKIWGYGALLLRGLAKIASEVALMNLTYNIRRVLNIVGTRKLILHLKQA
ncbi:MAG: IS1182 family transposase [Nitrososphaera sp.]|nr:IS1182 family transposase [Nitrososphaera sp.]